MIFWASMLAYDIWAFIAFSNLAGATDAMNFVHPVRTYLALANSFPGDAVQISSWIDSAIEAQIALALAVLIGSVGCRLFMARRHLPTGV